jgi:hypothetical protein
LTDKAWLGTEEALGLVTVTRYAQQSGLPADEVRRAGLGDAPPDTGDRRARYSLTLIGTRNFSTLNQLRKKPFGE